MKNNRIVTILVLLITILSGYAAVVGITSDDGPGEYEYTSIRSDDITIYGKGIYQHMSADVAIQGIAQDYVTLFIGIPLLLIGSFLFAKKSIKGQLLLSGTLMYFLVTYLFYTAMGMYNSLFLCYVLLLCLSFFAFMLTFSSFDPGNIGKLFRSQRLLQYAGIFLVLNSLMVASLWLSIIIPPLLDGSVYPGQLQHYTTLVVQGFDLGLLLPIAIVSGALAVKRNSYGYLFTTIYLIFLSILMAALTSKIIFMASSGENVIPVIFIMPAICLISVAFSAAILKRVDPGSLSEETHTCTH
ncbi:hypothetical protein [Methanolobus sp. WCC5]|uniref:hypothetical protein n=1 Tax=Methanolobus sp. WCC5 TaxID=3125785 RepID=UPI003250D386